MIKDENRYNPMKAGDQAPHNIKPLLSKPKILRELSPKQSKEDGPKITDVCFNCAKFKT